MSQKSQNAENKEFEPDRKLADVVARDNRYQAGAYDFVLESLEYTQRMFKKSGHVTGRELCSGVRQCAIERFGMMAKAVLNDWGIRKTDDVGRIVYNLVENGLLKTSADDAPADFKDLFDLDEAFVRDFKFDRPLKIE